MELYKNIRERRKQLDMSQDQLAQLAGYTDRTSISKIEAGKVDLTQSKIKAIADALRTTPAYLMGWSEDPMVNLVTHTAELSETVYTAQQVASALAGTQGFDSETLTHPNVKRVLSIAKKATADELLDAADYLEFQIKKRK